MTQPTVSKHCKDRVFDVSCSCDLEVDPMTFIYELDQYSLKIYWMSENELPTSRLSKVIVLQIEIQRDRQTLPKVHTEP